jgi:catechol 2,3-dioxygenase-like lactoylglutathione lyase family enzyme
VERDLRIDPGEIVPYNSNMIKSLGHICLRTHQLPVMVAFYRDVLGLTVKFGLKQDDGTEFGYYMAAGNTTFVEIFDHAGAAKQWGGDSGALKPNRGTFYNHFCLEVSGLEAFVARLEARGVKVRPIAVGMDHSKQAWIDDPDGNAIELMEYTPQSLQL